MLEIFVDADACPVREEVYRVARRCGLKVWVVSNGGVRVPDDPAITLVVVPAVPDAADDWIVRRIGPGDIAIVADVPLASRRIKKGARAIAPDGRAFTPASIGADLATRNLMAHLRETGQMRGGGRSFAKQDRARFLVALDAAIQAVRRMGR
jgi:uncharacterized protein YaiI (UPF0178 family)